MFKSNTLVSPCLLVTLSLLLSSCADDELAPSSDVISASANAHENSSVIEETGRADTLLEEQAQAGVWASKVFETETELMSRDAPARQYVERSLASSFNERTAYYGDLHVHTEYSFDAYAFGTLATPYDAYRFATGEPIKNAAGFDMQLSRPMDFYAVTDHAMFLGVAKAAAETDTEFSKNEFSQPYHELNSPENSGSDWLSILKRLQTFADFLPRAVTGVNSGELDRQEVLGVVRTAWTDTVDAAEQFYRPGEFTTFVGYEYTSSAADMGNLHRNVIFEGASLLPREPFSRFHSVNPEDLWQWMDDLRAKGVESLAIPHNSNGSNGRMFQTTTWDEEPLDQDYAKQRMRNEPIIELTQIKGTSETHPTLSSRDEFSGFEIMPYRVATNALSKIEGSYAREALLNGLSLEQKDRGNPFQFGFIGASDTHTAASQNDESNFSSKLGLVSATAEQRGSVPQGTLGNLLYYYSEASNAFSSSPRGRAAFAKVNGDIYLSGATITFGASGLAVAWAEENTRESIYSAFRRKEVFATSGPRIQLRFFAGHGLDESLLTAEDGIEQAYARGVTMGGNVLADESANGSPGFLFMATADPMGAPLQRVQVIKGWIDDDGNTQEEVIDVACANGASVNSKTNRCPVNGAKVDLSDCSINAQTGSMTLSAHWQDPDFDPEQRSFYYARVLENPTCRWSTWDAIRAGVTPRDDLAKTLQERAWSSPIHYIP
ncbi:MAG: DUF3604 domain-containing protein [Pseudomonadales bacterium]|nr:DUF3604 domain-containing protein [Pseudomonadales bacterium]MBO6597184.1 DUF3604 domain-containing protein [Pseudomonadales bacterium]MBO6823630.1 DUF3604 domain-containing protein [Pseudomonadales bacterium]